MKHAITLLLVVFNLSFAQTSREELLRQVQSRNDLNISKGAESDIYRVEYPDGQVSFKNLSIKMKTETTVSTTTVNVWEIDTTLYQNMYTYWQEVPVSTSSQMQLVVSDFNKNGYKEIFGYTKDYEDIFEGSPLTIYELDSTQHFVFRYIYNDTVRLAQAVCDIKQENNQFLFATSLEGNGLIYKSCIFGALPTSLDFVFYRYPQRRQMNNVTLDDFDKNGKIDLLFFELFELKSYIFEYDSVVNNFVFVDSLPPYFASCAGYAVGDFDSDGKTDIVYGGVHGEVHLVEADSEHSYSNVWNDTVDTFNAWMHMSTNDIDENGKPEFWVGGAAFYGPNPPITRFTCFEATGDNQYKEIHRIDIVGIFSFYAGNCFQLDVDKDGIEELVICLDQHVFIFKFNGKPGKHSYRLFYVKRNNLNGAYFGVTMDDLDDDGYEELLIHQAVVRQDEKGKHFTAVFKPNFINSADNDQTFISDNYLIEPCYPNPFNSSLNINFQIPFTSQAVIKVFDLLGTELTTVFKGEFGVGKHRITWDSKDRNNIPVNSGVYFIQFISGNFQKTIKALLIK